MIKFIKGIFLISRPINFILTFFVIFIACLISATDNYNYLIIILASLSGSIVASAGNIVNDYFDYEIDKINRPERVLPRHLITKNFALILFFIFSVISICIVSFISLAATIIVVLTITLLFFYSFYLKRLILIGNISVAFCTGLAFIFGGVVVNNWTYSIIPAAFAFLINLIREIVKDIEDIEGDSKNAIVTFPIKYGFKKTFFLVLTITVILIISTTIPFFYKLYRIEYFVVVMPVVNVLLVYILRELWRSQTKNNLRRISNLLKLDMLLGLIAIYLGK